MCVVMVKKQKNKKIPAIQLAKVCPENIYIVKCNQTNTYKCLSSVLNFTQYVFICILSFDK